MEDKTYVGVRTGQVKRHITLPLSDGKVAARDGDSTVGHRKKKGH